MAAPKKTMMALLGMAAFAESVMAMPEIRDVNKPARRKVRGYRLKGEDPNKGIGRNESCPCGSGKKFKKCCITKFTIVKK